LKNKKILIVYNTCSQKPQQHFNWSRVLTDIINQQIPNNEIHFASSDCCSAKKNKDFLVNFLDIRAPGKYWINHIDVPCSLQISFNHTVRKISQIEEYDYYVMWSSDVNFHDVGSLARVFDNVEENDAIIAPGWVRDLANPPHGDAHKFNNNVNRTILPVGYGFNGIFMIFSNKYVKAYDGKPFADLLVADCGECFLTYQAAAIKQHQTIVNSVLLNEFAIPKDGPSQTSAQQENLVKTYNLPGPSGRLTTINNSRYDFKALIEGGLQYGLGFQESDPLRWWMHNPECFDENYFAKTDELYQYMKKSFFVDKEDFDYDANISYFEEVTR